jgi:thioredoxin-dependent peroxiredoxin
VLITALGAKDAGSGKTKRAHFIFAKGGKLVDKKLPVSPGDRYVIISCLVLRIVYALA